jgi:predicted metal-binding membrane protein
MADMMPASLMAWTVRDIALNFLAWCLMMLGMMVPSAAPMILVFAAINRQKRARSEPFVPTAVFTAGYHAVWALFAIAATAAQWGLGRAALLSPQTERVVPWLGAGIVLAAGFYQLMPLKYACLSHCRSPFHFVLNRWRPGTAGALRMGVEHGLYCLGCCWMLMALLFAGGAMSLPWMAALAAFVLIEKLVPKGQWVARAGGVAMLALGIYLLTTAAA